MESPYETGNKDDAAKSNLQIIQYTPFKPCAKFLSPWFDLRVFYVRISNFQVDNSTPEFLTLNHIPLSPDTILEVNGSRSSMYSDGFSSLLRRDRVDRKTEEATFVNTDSIRTTGSVKFEVFDKEDLILSGVLEMSSGNGFGGEPKGNAKQWKMNCESEVAATTGFLKGKHIPGSESAPPSIEVYVTGSFAGTPIILTKTLQLAYRKRHNRKGMLDVIPEHESTETLKNVSYEHDLQMEEYRSYKPENEDDYNNSMYWRRAEYMDGEDGELSWFNAGVRVGVGIGLGICLGIGIGVGLFVRTYQTTTRNFKRRLA